MKKIIFGIFLAGMTSILYSQEVLLEKNVEEQYTGTRGPNMRHYGHLYVGAGMVADFGEEEGTAIDWWRSGQFMFGYRYKLKLLSFYAIGLDIGYKYTSYFFEDRNSNPFQELNPLTWEPERDRHSLANNGIGLELYHRINIGRRGNSLGKYFDTGFRGQWNFADAEEILIRTDDKNVPAMRTKIKNRRLNYIEPFSYGLTARVGFNKIVVHASYRLSDYFRDKINESVSISIPEVPRLAAGVQLVLQTISFLPRTAAIALMSEKSFSMAFPTTRRLAPAL